MHQADKAYTIRTEHLVVLLAGPISHTSIQYMDFNVSLNLSTNYLLLLMGVELPLCAVVTPF